MDLFLIRHAWAEERSDEKWPDDALRPLTAQGRERFEQVCRRLTDRVLKPKWIATSPMVRCRQTAEILAASLGGGVKIAPCDELLPGGDFKILLDWLNEHRPTDEAIACVGHAPDLGCLVASLIGADGVIRMAKGAVAAIRFAGEPELGNSESGKGESGKGELRWLVSAKVLGL